MSDQFLIWMHGKIVPPPMPGGTGCGGLGGQLGIGEGVGLPAKAPLAPAIPMRSQSVVLTTSTARDQCIPQ